MICWARKIGVAAAVIMASIVVAHTKALCRLGASRSRNRFFLTFLSTSAASDLVRPLPYKAAARGSGAAVGNLFSFHCSWLLGAQKICTMLQSV